MAPRLHHSAGMKHFDETKLSKAFKLVDPGERAKFLAAVGLISEAAASRHSWRDEIAALVLDSDLVAAGVTTDDIREAVAYYTATEATITTERIGGLSHVHFLEAVPGYFVRAKGYRAGPAGP